MVFPTCVGVFLADFVRADFIRRLPHVRGGVSNHDSLARIVTVSSPRAWGCFPCLTRSTSSVTVFPTCVGVFLLERRDDGVTDCLPHVRGGVS